MSLISDQIILNSQSKINQQRDLEEIFVRKEVKYLEIDNFQKCNVEQFLENFFQLESSNQSLEQIQFSGIHINDNYLRIIQNNICKNLKKINFADSAKLSAQGLDDFFCNLKNCKIYSLNLAFCSIKDSCLKEISQNNVFSDLDYINLSYCNQISIEGFDLLFKSVNSRNLKKISLQGVLFQDPVLINLSQCQVAVKLEYLKLKSCTKFTDDSFKILIKQLKQLKYLDISQTLLTPESMKALSESELRQLEQFKCYECPFQKKEGLDFILNAPQSIFQTLQYLDLSWTTLNDQQLQIINSIPNILIEISIGKCSELTSFAFEGFLQKHQNWKSLKTLLVGFNQILEKQISDIIQKIQNKMLFVQEIWLHGCPNLTNEFISELKNQASLIEILILC